MHGILFIKVSSCRSPNVRIFTMKLYNTLSQKIESFQPINDTVRMYVCGPTVYDAIHIGNARAFVVFDLLYRILKHRFSSVVYVRNITDVDDKIIARAKELGIPTEELTSKYTDLFHKNMRSLCALAPSHEPKATQTIAEMVELIQVLVQKKHAYICDNHVLFDTTSLPNYGQFSKKTLCELLAGIRVNVESYKTHKTDFVLWKPAKKGEIGWDSPFGYGRPGWHLECSAMSHKYLGIPFDIHGGGIDLIFPHHENEMAQSCCAFYDMHKEKGNMANFWVHNCHLFVDGQKMSKSLGNFLTVAGLLELEHPEVIRLALLMSHYRHPLNWNTKKTLTQARRIWEKLLFAIHDLKDVETISITPCEAFVEVLEDDLNTPKAIAMLLDMASSKSPYLLASCQFMGFFENQCPLSCDQQTRILARIQERTRYKEAKNYEQADAVRLELLKEGIILNDGREETTWYFVPKR